MYALIKNGIVENCIIADAEFAAQIALEWDDVVAMATVETCGIGWTYANGVFTAPTPIVPPVPADPAEWLIDLGPFYDRFSTAKMAVLTSDDTGVKAILADLNIRKWVDLKRQDVADSLVYVGTKVTAVTAELQNSILTTPVTIDENRALRKLYF